MGLSRERTERASLVAELEQLTGCRVEIEKTGPNEYEVRLRGNRHDPLLAVRAAVSNPNPILKLAADFVEAKWY